MRLLFFKSTWGYDRSEFREMLPQVKMLGFDGVDIKITAEDTQEELKALKELIDRHELKITCMIKSWPTDPINYTQLPGGTIETHVEYYRTSLVNALKMDPEMINCQSGSDVWTEDESVTFYKSVLEVDRELGAPGRVCQETHRQRALFHPYRSRRILDKVPGLQLTADVSHWTCVCERLLDVREDDIEVMSEILPRMQNIHARIGTTQASQCPVPTDPIYTKHRQYFENLWKSIVTTVARQGKRQTLCVLSEYGPWPYMTPHVSTHFGDLGDSEFARVSQVLRAHLKNL